MLLRQIYYHLAVPISNRLRDKVVLTTLSTTRNRKQSSRDTVSVLSGIATLEGFIS